jgi:formylglycine-generating enzyme required for sulfatase activity
VTTFDWVEIPAGNFWMGSAAGDADEKPLHRVFVPTFLVTRTHVTNAQYFDFVRETQHAAPGHWQGGQIPQGLENHPVTYVDWFDAQQFAEWCGTRLPTEAEWEKAARGGSARADEARAYPWGNSKPDATRANYNANVRTTTPIGEFPRGASLYGVLDMAGNAWQWISSLYQPYPYQADDGREEKKGVGMRVVRGGSYIHPAREIRAAYRHRFYPTARDSYIGFRIVKND